MKVRAGSPVDPGNIRADVLIVAVVAQHSAELRQDGKRDKERAGVRVICQVPQHGRQLQGSKVKQKPTEHSEGLELRVCVCVCVCAKG